MDTGSVGAKRAILAGVASVSLVLGACGDDDDDDAWGDTADCTHEAEGEALPAVEAPEGIDGVLAYEIDTVEHGDGCLPYGLVPPVGGHHNAEWATCDFYSEPVPNVHVVHSLEHGAIWIAFDPDLADEDQQAIRDLVADRDGKLLASPYPEVDAEVVVTAWARQLVLPELDESRIDEFIDTYESGAQSPEPNAPC